MDAGWGTLNWWTGWAKGSWKSRSKGVWEGSGWTRELHKRMGTCLCKLQNELKWAILAEWISLVERGQNDKEIDNMRNYYGVLFRRISDTKNGTVYQGSLCFRKGQISWCKYNCVTRTWLETRKPQVFIASYSCQCHKTSTQKSVVKIYCINVHVEEHNCNRPFTTVI